MSATIRVLVNGQEREIPAGSSVAWLRGEVGLSQTPCAAEVNKELVPVRKQAETTLRDGDTVELVTLVGGG